MKKIDLGQTIGIVASIGVLVGILLLVYELNQNRQMMQAQTRNAIAQTLIDLQRDQANNSELAGIMVKVAAGEPLSPVEVHQYRASWVATFRYWENVNYQYRNGLYEESEYSAQRRAWSEIISNPAVLDLWCGRRHRQSEELVAEIDALLGDAGCE